MKLDDKTPKTTAAFVIDAQQAAMIKAFAKDQGYPTVSSALRRIIDEWARMKARQIALAPDAACDEEARAVGA